MHEGNMVDAVLHKKLLNKVQHCCSTLIDKKIIDSTLLSNANIDIVEKEVNSILIKLSKFIYESETEEKHIIKVPNS